MSITIPFPEYPDPLPPSSDGELEIQRLNTKAFIDADPISLRLIPVTFGRTSSGGKKGVDGAPRADEIFRLIPTSDAQPGVQTPDGVVLTPTFVLLGEWFSTMDRWDKFLLNGSSYQIISPVRPEHTEKRYFSKADVGRF